MDNKEIRTSRVILNSTDSVISASYNDHNTKYTNKFIIESVSIPQSFYFVSGNIHWESTGSGGPQTQSLTTQNYTGTQLASHLQTLLTIHDATATVTYDSQTMKLTFTAAGMEVFADSTAGVYFGMGTTDLGPLASITMPNVIYVRPRCIHVRSDDMVNSHANLDNTTQTNILFTAMSDAVMGQQVTYRNVHIDYYYEYNRLANRMTFYLTTDNNTTQLDLNGLEFCLSLIVKHVRK